MKKFFSRKLFMAIASMASILLGDYSISGTVHTETLMAVSAIAVAYLGMQGYVDSKEKSIDK